MHHRAIPAPVKQKLTPEEFAWWKSSYLAALSRTNSNFVADAIDEAIIIANASLKVLEELPKQLNG